MPCFPSPAALVEPLIVSVPGIHEYLRLRSSFEGIREICDRVSHKKLSRLMQRSIDHLRAQHGGAELYGDVLLRWLRDLHREVVRQEFHTGTEEQRQFVDEVLHAMLREM